MTSPFSERAPDLPEPNALTRAVHDRRARGEPIVDLTLGNPTLAAIRYDEAAILRALADPASLRYQPEPFGLPSARQAIATEIGAPADRILLTASTSEAYAFLFSLLCDQGDEVLVPQPGYPLLAHLAHAAGIALVPYSLRYDGRWSFDAPELFDALSDRTRAIVAVSPNNPTGSILSVDELAALAALGLPLIVDEVFAGYELEGRGARAASQSDVLTFALSGLSKTAGLPQLKLAWTSVSGPEGEVREALARLELIADTFLSVATPVQVALPSLLASAAVTREAIRERTRSNLRWLRSVVPGSALTVPLIEGGWYAPLRLPLTRSDEAWALALLERGVLVHPGYFYDFPDDEAWLVVSLLTPQEDMRVGIEALLELALSR